ncbi:MAG: flippase-like domain-containing protein, partial [Anaerolineae bacterium]|nr:flippase-like domain-containing protein [Anaerolineae bacterium]
MRRIVLIAASLLMSGLILWLVLRDMPLAQVWEQMRQANVFWLVATIISIHIAIWTRAIRWRGMLPGSSLTTMQAFYILGITFTLNLLPLRAGEVARSLLATRYGIPFVTAATSVVIERLVDTLLVVVLLAVALSRVPAIPPQTAQVATLFGTLAVIGFAVLVFCARYPALPRGLLARAQRLLPVLKRLPLTALLEHGLDGLEPLTHWRLFAHTLLWTLISWGVSLVTLMLLHVALNLGDVDVLLSSSLGATLASLSLAIPISVAGLGPFQAAMLAAGQLAGMDDVRALSLGFVFHGVTTLAYLLLGGLAFARLGVSLGD